MPKPKPGLVVINDVSEQIKHRALIKEFVRSAYSGEHRIVKASTLRKRVFDFLKRDTQKQKYDLILLGDRGGTLLFSSSELRSFGQKIGRIPYSLHHPQGLSGYAPLLYERLSSLGHNPRVLLLESDVGARGYTAQKLADMETLIRAIRKDAEISAVGGAVHEPRQKRMAFKYIAYPSPAKPVRLSELLEELEGSEGLRKRIREIQRKRALTGTLPH